MKNHDKTTSPNYSFKQLKQKGIVNKYFILFTFEAEVYFIDLFAGCGGLSLGLSKAGWRGLFAIEKSPDAFQTLKHNLVDKNIVAPFEWPKWLPCEPMTISTLIKKHGKQLKKLKGKIDLIAGGPPCQGFSFAGRRNPNDARNKLTAEYIKVVKLIQPNFLLLENVKGFQSAFKQTCAKNKKVYAEVVKENLEKLGYEVFHKMCEASEFGVPQPRSRFILIAYKKGKKIKSSPFDTLKKIIPKYRSSKGIAKTKNINVKVAISDLAIENNDIIDSVDTNNYIQISYKKKRLTAYQKLMRKNCDRGYIPNSLRLARHNDKTIQKFKTILKKYPKGKSLTKKQLLELGTKKQCITPLHPDMICRTITTIPDDLLHYKEPRILTVRENARIQSFPDWFDFLGKYTTGGLRRREECPRYTQVGNAVPPLMAEGIGVTIMKMRRGYF